MKFIRFAEGDSIQWGRVSDQRVEVLRSAPWLSSQSAGRSLGVDEVTALAPVIPGKIIGVGRNYADHARELGNEAPAEPLLFLKPPSAVIGPGDVIRMPSASERVDYEGELAVVIGKLARDLPESRWREVVFGYSCGNDVTARDLQKRDVQFTRAKGFDSFCPLGPAIETEIDPEDLALVTRVNGEVRQSGRTSQMIFSVPRLIAAISAIMTLEPGDVILTGTPSGVGPLSHGDTVEIEIEGIGTLINRAER